MQSLRIKSAIPHPRIMGVIRECGGKMHMTEGSLRTRTRPRVPLAPSRLSHVLRAPSRGFSISSPARFPFPSALSRPSPRVRLPPPSLAPRPTSRF